MSLHAIARDDRRSGEDEIRAETLDDRGVEDGEPVILLRRHGRQHDLGHQHRHRADGQDPLGRQPRHEPGGDECGGGGADGDGREAKGRGEDGPVADLLLPGDEVPDEGAVGHEAEDDDGHEGEEGARAEDGQREDGVPGEFLLPEGEGAEEGDGGDQEGDFVGRAPSGGRCLAGTVSGDASGAGLGGTHTSRQS